MDNMAYIQVTRILLSKGFLNTSFCLKQMVSTSGDSNHFLVLMETTGTGKSPPSLLKLYSEWMKD